MYIKTYIMKALIPILVLLSSLFPVTSRAQSDEAQQLLLNVEKLAQFKAILKNMKKGYDILSKGYNRVKDISKGNFSIHDAFLDALMKVSPTVRNYRKVADIITCQGSIVKEYRSAFNRFNASQLFNPKEIAYMSSIYGNLINKSLGNLDELAMVITSNKLRMSDDERLAAIDRIHKDITDKLDFLRSFNRGNSVLAIQRGREKVETKVSKQLHGLP